MDWIASQCAERPRTLVGDDPVELKRMIGECGVLVGSRFHALVSALSQGVPAIGTSWSHKYQRLFEEYAIPELLVPDNAHADVEGLLGRVWKDRARHAEGIAEKAAELEARSHSMWSEVLRQIGIGQPSEGGR